MANALRTDTLKGWSPTTNRSIPNLVSLSERYSVPYMDFPILYLLHGAGGNCTNWILKVPQLKDYADRYNMIIVCPDGEVTSWYLGSPVDRKMKYETCRSQELVPSIDEEQLPE